MASGGIPAPANGAAVAADWMSAASFISLAGFVSFSQNGYAGSVYLSGWTGGYVLLALLLAPYLRKFGKYTVPDFVGNRYSESARMVAVICAIVVSFVDVAGQMAGAGLVFQRFLEVNTTVGIIIGMTIVFFYAVLGGMKGITWTQVAQYSVLIVVYIIPAVAISSRYSAPWALFFISLLYTTAPAIGAFSKFNVLNQLSGTEEANAPAWYNTWKEVGLIESNDVNRDGIIDIAGGASAANELLINNDIVVLAAPGIAGLPSPIVGLVAAGGLAAALSTASGLLLIISSSVANDVYFKKPTRRPLTSSNSWSVGLRWAARSCSPDTSASTLPASWRRSWRWLLVWPSPPGPHRVEPGTRGRRSVR